MAQVLDTPMNDTDIEVIVEGLKKIVHVVENAPSFKSIGSKFSRYPFPSCIKMEFRSDDYWRCLARHLTLTVHHFTGTAAMGAAGSSTAVVDSELRVMGTQNLRVVDASIMPVIPTVNTNAPTVMIGERGAQLIKSAVHSRM